MMMNIPSAPGGAAAADPVLPGVAASGALPAPADAEGGAGSALPALFAQMLDLAGLALPVDGAPVAAQAATPAVAQDQAGSDDGQPADDAPADAALAAMLPVLNLAVLPVVQPDAVPASAPAAGTPRVDGIAGQPVPAVAAGTPATVGSAAAQLRQAAADALTSAPASVAPAMLPVHLMRAGGLPAAADPAPRQSAGESRQAAPASVQSGNATATGATAAAPQAILVASSDGNAQSGQDGQGGQSQPEQASFRTVMGAASTAQPATTAAADTVKLAGSAEQWQQPLRAALGDRLQLQLQKGNEHAVIRLDPPNLGSIEISIRQTAGALQVNLSATHNEVVRQLNAVGDAMRNDLSQRQLGDVAVTVTPSAQRSLADSDGRGRQPERDQQQERAPGRALNEGDETSATFAMRE